MKKNAIVLLADKSHIEKTKQVIYSSYKYGGWKEDYVLLAQGVPEKNLEWFRKKNIVIRKIKPITKKGSGHHPNTVYSKFYLFDEHMKKWDKIIYLDTDIIVRKNITKLLKYNEFAAGKESYKRTIIEQFEETNPVAFRKIKEKYNYFETAFNTGVMVIPTKINSEQTKECLKKLLKRYGNITKWGDQGILNLYFINKWKELPYIFNDYYSSEPYNRKGLIKRKDDKDAAILHIIHPYKPWNKKSEYYKEWKRNMEDADKLFKEPQENKFPGKLSALKVEIINNINTKILRMKYKPLKK